MTPKQADRLIKAGKPVTVAHPQWGQIFTFTPTHRDRWNIYDAQGRKFDRGELVIVQQLPD